jgi:hypothetical protein
VVEPNEKLVSKPGERFYGTSLKIGRILCNCSDIAILLSFFKEEGFRLQRAKKVFVGKKYFSVNGSKKNDKRTV